MRLNIGDITDEVPGQVTIDSQDMSTTARHLPVSPVDSFLGVGYLGVGEAKS